MPEDASSPVAIRITRPYATEEEFLEQELETLTRTTVTLVGAQARPAGVVLRFELVLASGQVLLRGEGRVIAFKPNVVRGAGGLALRFTRLDSRSKALVDRAALFRERRRSAQNPTSTPALPSEASTPELLSAPDSSRPLIAPAPDPSGPELPPSATRPRPKEVSERLDAPPDREALLERLRSRARAFDAAKVQEILDSRRRA